MRDIKLERVPNQEFSFSAGGHRWTVRVKVARMTMAVDVWVDDEPVIFGQRAVTGTPVIPYAYLAERGNLAFITEGDQYPWWEQFGLTQSLVYLTADELAPVYEY